LLAHDAGLNQELVRLLLHFGAVVDSTNLFCPDEDQLEDLFIEMDLIKRDRDERIGFPNGTLFEFSIRNEHVVAFDRLVTLPSSYNVRQLKIYLQQTLAKEQQLMT
jgi:hypothetical protein